MCVKGEWHAPKYVPDAKERLRRDASDSGLRNHADQSRALHAQRELHRKGRQVLVRDARSRPQGVRVYRDAVHARLHGRARQYSVRARDQERQYDLLLRYPDTAPAYSELLCEEYVRPQIRQW